MKVKASRTLEDVVKVKVKVAQIHGRLREKMGMKESSTMLLLFTECNCHYH